MFMDLGQGVVIGGEFVEEFCRLNRVRRLAVFGSLPGEKLTIDSDVDLLEEPNHAFEAVMMILAGGEPPDPGVPSTEK